MTKTATSEPAFWDVKATANRFGVSPATIWRWVREGRFPAPVQLGDNCTRWRITDVLAWEEELPAFQTATSKGGQINKKPASKKSERKKNQLYTPSVVPILDVDDQ